MLIQACSNLQCYDGICICDKLDPSWLWINLYYNGSFAQNQISCQRRSPFTFRRLCPLRRAYWLAHEVFQVKKIFPRIWRSLCAHFSIFVSSRLIGIKVKSAARKEARHISLTLSASQGLLARPWSVPSEKNFSPHMAVALCALFNIC